MTTATQSIRLLGFFLVVVMSAGCGGNASWLTACGTYIAKDTRETDVFETSLSTWLQTNGFRPAEDPADVTSWAGLHTAGEITKWYQGSYRDSPPFLLRMQKVPRTDIGGGWTDYHFDCAWHVSGSKTHIADMETASATFAEAFRSWLEERNAPPNGENVEQRR